MAPYARMLQPPRGSFFLFGPRGTGKSTWARGNFPKARRFDLLDEGLYHELIADPALFAGELRTLAPGSAVVVDEIQRIPGLLNEVHRFIEERRLRFALLGSSAKKLKTAGTNLLAGRASSALLHPFVPAELGSDFDLEEVLRHGSLPLVWTSADKRATLTSYVQVYLREEIQAEALVRNLPSFARFLPLAALFHGQALNVSSLARDSGTARTTIVGYLDILEQTLLAFRLPAYEAKLRVRERKHPKLYWVDPGIVRAAKKQLGAVGLEERGALLEGWVLGCLRAHAEVQELYDEIYYWAPAQGRLEVDFLLERGARKLAIEVKSGRKLAPEMLYGLRAINGLEGLARRILVYGGERKQQTPDGIDVWPPIVLAQALEAGRLW
jgi:predicted AAA+ superfamily ATPase